MQDALGLNSDQVYHWRLLLEEYDITIVYIKGIHNTVADTMSWMDYGPITDDQSNRMTFAQCWCYYSSAQDPNKSMAKTKESKNLVFADWNEEDSIYQLITRELVEAQQQDNDLKEQAEKEDFST